MRKIWPLLLVLLVACTPAITPAPEIITVTETITTEVPPAANLRVYDSPWNIVAEEYIADSRAITTDALLSAYVEEYNAANTDSQLFIITGVELVPVEYAPKVNAWIVAPGNYARLRTYVNQSRADLSTLRELWRTEAATLGGILYIDRLPPDEIIPVVKTAYELYALYVIDPTGAIYAETHCEEWAEWGYASQADLYATMLPLYRLEAQQHGAGWTCIAGEIYKP